MENNQNQYNSYFDGGLLQLIGWTILGTVLTAATFGICFSWALCIWFFFTIVTFGIYGFWLYIALEKWKVKNTSFAN